MDAEARTRAKTGAARLSILSNSGLIVLKLVAGAVTGSIAIVTEAIHSSIDLLASVVAFFSVSRADRPADEDHLYGHSKLEYLAAAIEGMLILVGAGVIIFAAARRLAEGAEVDTLEFGIAAVGVSAVVNLGVSTYLYRRARVLESAALESDAAHLRADAITSVAVLIGLVLVETTGMVELDSVVALVVATAIVYMGIRILLRSSRVLMDEALPSEELDVVRNVIDERRLSGEVAGFHKLRGRRAGRARHIDLHVQFPGGTTLEHAHDIAHELQGEIRRKLDSSADVLVHIEPQRGAGGARVGQQGPGDADAASPGGQDD